MTEFISELYCGINYLTKRRVEINYLTFPRPFQSKSILLVIKELFNFQELKSRLIETSPMQTCCVACDDSLGCATASGVARHPPAQHSLSDVMLPGGR